MHNVIPYTSVLLAVFEKSTVSQAVKSAERTFPGSVSLLLLLVLPFFSVWSLLAMTSAQYRKCWCYFFCLLLKSIETIKVDGNSKTQFVSFTKLTDWLNFQKVFCNIILFLITSTILEMSHDSLRLVSPPWQPEFTVSWNQSLEWGWLNKACWDIHQVTIWHRNNRELQTASLIWHVRMNLQ